jgi:hypothetical protein
MRYHTDETTHIGNETAMKYADNTVRLITSFFTYPFNLLVTQLSIALPVWSMCSVSYFRT